MSRREMLQSTGAVSLASWLASTNLSAQNQSTMLHRNIPSSNEKLPVVGLGSWIQFDVGSGTEEREGLTQVLKNMHNLGGRLIDSSPMYGRAEEVIGDLASGSGAADDFFYATKIWTTGKQAGIEQMNDSFRKMRRSTMDLMQIHNLQDWQTHIKTLEEWTAAGKIRYIGVTHYMVSAHEALEKIVKSKVVDFVQVNYSIRERNAGKSLLNTAKDYGVAVIINEPFDSGNLFKIVKGKELPAWAAEYDIKSWAQYFLKYILANPAVNCVIPGTSDTKHVIDNMGAGFGRLPDRAGLKRMLDYVEKI
jgi:diketogulonate reductase-like aldo/keto reductase